jgi:hypothetical protein
MQVTRFQPVRHATMPNPAIAYGVAVLGHSADARKLQVMRLPDLAARSQAREFQALASLLLVAGQAKED